MLHRKLGEPLAAAEEPRRADDDEGSSAASGHAREYRVAPGGTADGNALDDEPRRLGGGFGFLHAEPGPCVPPVPEHRDMGRAWRDGLDHVESLGRQLAV